MSDANQNVMVQVNFTKFEFDAKFDKDFFQMERNMTSWNMQTLPTMSDVKVTDADHPAASVTDKTCPQQAGSPIKLRQALKRMQRSQMPRQANRKVSVLLSRAICLRMS